MVTCKRNLASESLSHVNSLHAHEWEKMWQWALFTSSNSEGRHNYEHTYTKQPTIKMTMRLFECELMYSLSVFTSRHPTIQTYFTQISNDPDHAIASEKTGFKQYADEHLCTYGYFWPFFKATLSCLPCINIEILALHNRIHGHCSNIYKMFLLFWLLRRINKHSR